MIMVQLDLLLKNKRSDWFLNFIWEINQNMSSDWDMLDDEYEQYKKMNALTNEPMNEQAIVDNMKQIMTDEPMNDDMRKRNVPSSSSLPSSPTSPNLPRPPNPPRRVVSIRTEEDYGVCSHALSYVWYLVLCGFPSCC